MKNVELERRADGHAHYLGRLGAMTIRARINRLARNKMLRSIGVLVGGTAFAHGITALTLPIVTRLYTPADFSVLAVFASILSIVSVAACLRFDVAIPIPEHDDEAANLLALALGFSAFIAVLLAVLVLALPQDVLPTFNQPKLATYLWLLPPGVLLAAGYSALQMWFVRKQAFTSITSSRVAQSAAAAGTQVTMGWQHWAPTGLILGLLLNTGAGCLILGYRFARHHRDALNAITRVRMRSAFASYVRFPKYSTFEAVCNSASIQLPIIMVAALASGPEAGFLILAMAAMQAPMGLIGTAVSQVYLSRAPEEHRAGRLNSFTAGIFGALIKSGVGPLVFAGFIAPELFAIVFGSEWRRAGVLVAWMTPWFIMQFLSVPVSMALHVTGNQRAALALQIFGLVLRTGAVCVTGAVASGFISEAYALSGFVFYLAYLIIVMRVVSARTSDVVREGVRALPFVLGWAAAGWIMSIASNELHLLTH